MTSVNCAEVHRHSLNKVANLSDHTCDVCKQVIKADGYRCPDKECDFDYCEKCFDQKRTYLQCDKIFSEEPYACDFYKQSFHVRMGSNEYKQIVDMHFQKQARSGHSNWYLAAQDINGKFEIFFGSKYGGLSCNGCRLTFSVDCENDEMFTVPYIKCEGDLYSISGEESSRKRRIHLDKIMQKLFPDIVVLTLRGTYCA